MSGMKDDNDMAGRDDSARSFLRGLKGLSQLWMDDALRAVSEAAGPEAAALYLVGGTLRNIALGKPPAPDYDFSFAGDVRALAAAVSGRLGASFFALDEEAGAWRVVAKDGTTVDFTPTAAGGIAADLGKRDFTVNALALPVKDFIGGASLVIDPFGGVSDAGEAVLRKVSSSIFDDDPVRMLRAVRLSAQYSLAIERHTLELLLCKASLVSSASPERARDELVSLMRCADSAKGVGLLFSSGLMRALVPETDGWDDVSGYDLLSHSLAVLGEADRLIATVSDETFPGVGRELSGYLLRPGPVPVSVIFRLAALFHDFGKASTLSRGSGKLRFLGHDSEGAEKVAEVMERLRFSRKNSGELAMLVKEHHRAFMLASLKERSPRAKIHFFRATGGESGLLLLCLALVDARATRGGEDPELLEVVLEMMRFYFDVYSIEKPPPLMTGAQVMDTFGVAEGPVVGEILRKINEGVEQGVVRNRKEAVAYVRKWLREKKGDTG